MIYFQLKVYEIETALPKFPALCPWLCMHAVINERNFIWQP